jgi:hypothetical protein
MALAKGASGAVVRHAASKSSMGSGGGGKGVEIAVARRAIAPAIKARALFERGVTGAQEFALRNADHRQRLAHRGPCALANADGGNVAGLHQRDGQIRAARSQKTGRKPAGGPPPTTTTRFIKASIIAIHSPSGRGQEQKNRTT